MEKKVYYLMLLLCFTLFPFRVYALDDIPLNDNNNTSDVVDLQLGDKQGDEEKQPGEEQDEKKEGEQQENLDAGSLEEQKNEEPNINESLEGNGEEVLLQNTNEETLLRGDSKSVIEQLTITNVPTELKAGEAFAFGGQTGDTSYQIIRELWNDDIDYYHVSNDSVYNDELREEGSLLESVATDAAYHYSFYIQVSDGYSLGEADEHGNISVPISINGTSYMGCFANEMEENIYYFYTPYVVHSIDESMIYQEDLTLNDANTTPTEGREPLYGAELEEEHFTLASEVWYTYEYTYDDEGWLTDIHVYVNYSDDSYQADYEETFTVFSKDKLYSYGIVVVPDEGYRLKINYDENNFATIPITVQGEKKEAQVFVVFDEEGNLQSYEITVLEDIEPTSEEYSIVEHADTTIDKSEGTDLAIRSNGSYTNFQNVYVDGQILDPEHYTNGDGETIVKFTNDYLQTLSVGTHTIALSFSDGKNAYTTLTITDVENEENEEVNLAEDTTTPATDVVVTTNQGAPVVNNVVRDDLVLESADEETENKSDEPKKEKEEEEEKEEKESKLGLWIGLGALLLVAVAIPVIIYKREEE